MDARFEALLLAYAEAGAEAEARGRIEAQLWKEFGRATTVFVMDMAGFSLLTQKYGIVHYLSLVKRMQAVARPAIERHGGVLVKFEADNCFAAFDSALPAVRAAIEINETFARLNETADERFVIRVAVGIDHGDVLMIGGPDYFGAAVNRASKLGEDVAGPGEIYVTRTAFALIPKDAGIEGREVPVEVSGMTLDAFEVMYR